MDVCQFPRWWYFPLLLHLKPDGHFFLYLFCKSPKNSVPLVPQEERAIPGAGYPEVIYFSTTFRTIATYKFAFRQLFSSIVNFFTTCLLQSSGKITVHPAWRRNQFPLNSFDFVIIANFRQRDRRHRFIDRSRQRIWEEGGCRIVWMSHQLANTLSLRCRVWGTLGNLSLLQSSDNKTIRVFKGESSQGKQSSWLYSRF